jgi:hypothetical protein
MAERRVKSQSANLMKKDKKERILQLLVWLCISFGFAFQR